jgi:hypothetical protein
LNKKHDLEEYDLIYLENYLDPTKLGFDNQIQALPDMLLDKIFNIKHLPFIVVLQGDI